MKGVVSAGRVVSAILGVAFILLSGKLFLGSLFVLGTKVEDFLAGVFTKEYLCSLSFVAPENLTFILDDENVDGLTPDLSTRILLFPADLGFTGVFVVKR